MSTWVDRLQTALGASGKRLVVWQSGDGQLLVTPFAARVVGCQLPGVEANVFWHDPGMEDEHKAAAKLTGAGGGIGGDRLWIAPEIGYIWPDLQAARVDPYTTSKLPAYMDPGNWHTVSSLPGHLRLQMQMSLVDHRTNRKVTLDVERVMNTLDAPPQLPGSLHTCSFAIRNTMTLVDGDHGAVAGLWDLLQMPTGGVLICPTRTPMTQPPRSYYEPYRESDVTWDQAAVYFHARGDHVIKMGLAPHQTTGLMGYLRRIDDRTSSLIVRQFLPIVGGAYVDLPRSSDDLTGGDALQAFCGNGTFADFCEMEHHDPALIVGSGDNSVSGMCATHVLAGPDSDIRAAAHALLGVVV